jgi:hypothetical protein
MRYSRWAAGAVAVAVGFAALWLVLDGSDGAAPAPEAQRAQPQPAAVMPAAEPAASAALAASTPQASASGSFEARFKTAREAPRPAAPPEVANAKTFAEAFEAARRAHAQPPAEAASASPFGSPR